MDKEKSKNQTIKILVASHKDYRMPQEAMYIPIQVGAEGKQLDLGWQKDNEGDNISSANARLCELTAIYWAWKNLDADYLGLVHYRRHFTNQSKLKRIGKNKFDCVLTHEELNMLLAQYDVIVPTKRKYYIETMKSHFIHLPYTFEKDYDIWEKTLKTMNPDYADAFDHVMNRDWAHMFNMFIMKKELFDAYCEWMFPILLETDRQIDVTGYSAMEARAVAYFGEFMLDIWMEKNPQKVREMKVMFMEKQNIIVKYTAFLCRKFRGGYSENVISFENRSAYACYAVQQDEVAA